MDEHNISVALKPSGPNLSFALPKFNSVAPLGSIDKNIERDLSNPDALGENDMLERHISNQSGLLDATGLGKTNYFFNNMPPPSHISAVTNEVQAGTMTNLMVEKEKTKRRNRKNKKNQKQILLLKL